MRNAVLILCSIMLLFAVYILRDDARVHPRLVGFGCEGSSGPLYAMEEDHFPPCTVIHRVGDTA